MFLLRTEAGLSLAGVGDVVGGRDHSTIIHGVEKVNRLISESPKIRAEVLRVKEVIHK